MLNGRITYRFLATLNQATAARIINEIADRYGISPNDARAEITDDEAEHLLDYLTGSVRTATSLLMKRNGFA